MADCRTKANTKFDWMLSEAIHWLSQTCNNNRFEPAKLAKLQVTPTSMTSSITEFATLFGYM